MNISDAAREAALKIDHWLTKPGLPGLEECVQTAITTATAALTLELETVKRSRDGLHATLEYGVQTMREVEAERDHYQSTMEQSVTMAESYRIERDQLQQQLAEAREDSKRLDLAEKHGASITFAMTPDMGGYNWQLYMSGHPRQKRDRTIRQALDRIQALYPPTDEK